MTTTWESSAWVEVSEEPGSLILRLCGELDIATRDMIESAVMAAIPTVDSLILDLGDLTFCDSSGVAMFLAAREKAQAEGTALTLGNLRANVARVFAVSGVDQVLAITE